MKILVLDTETTGLKGNPVDFVIEISICEVDTNNKSVDVLYDSLVGYDVYQWNFDPKFCWIFEFTDLKPDDLLKAPSLWKVISDVRSIVNDRIVTSYNTEFDFYRFLDNYPWLLCDFYKEQFECIMLMATERCKIVNTYMGGYKWPKLSEAVAMLGIKEKKIKGGFHRSLYDTVMSSYVLLELIDSEGNFIREVVNDG